MNNEEMAPIKVRYKWNNGIKWGDLVCELTEFIDKYLLSSKATNTFFRTYLFNDISALSNNSFLQMSFRAPRCNTRWNYIKTTR